MGTHAERVAIKDHVSRADQDAFALASHQKAIAAIDAGRFDAEMAPVTVRDAKGRETVVDDRRGPAPRLDRRGARPPQAGLRAARRRGPRRRHRRARSRPATRPGSPTVRPPRSSPASAPSSGSASSPSPGSSATPRPRSRPKWLFLAPVEGVRRLLDRIELPIEAFDLIEINEAFAAQTLADGRELGFDWDKVNVNGGAIALGHPIGASRRPDRRHAAPRARAAARAATASRPSASAAAAPSRWPSSGSDRGSSTAASPTRGPSDRWFSFALRDDQAVATRSSYASMRSNSSSAAYWRS